MDSANQPPTNGSVLPSFDAADKENVSSTFTQTEEIQGPKELSSEYALKVKIARLTSINRHLQNENAQLRQEKLELSFQMIRLIENAHEVAKPKSKLVDLKPLVIKKLQYNENQNVWLGYLTMDEDEKPKPISIVNSDLVIDGIVSQKKLIIDGVFTQYESDPFLFHHIGGCNGRFDVSRLLKKILSCEITDFSLYSQDLVWKEFEKLISSKTIKNLYFANNRILDEKNKPVSIEKILEYAPNIESAAYMDDISKETFKKLLKLPVFAKLRQFVIDDISFHDFDAESFLAFMKKHPDADFKLSFLLVKCNEHDKAEYQKMKLMLESRAPAGKLHIQSM